MKFSISDSSKNYIVEILNSNEERVATYNLHGAKAENKDLRNLPAGAYHMKVIEDSNSNGKWDTGDLSLKKQPERTLTFKDTYALKGGWDLDVEVKF